MIGCMILGILAYLYHVKKTEKVLAILINNTANIIEDKGKPLLEIDGESYLAVLSNHLALLDTRMKGLVDKLYQEQIYLKDYIEDISYQIKTPLTSMMLREEMLQELITDEKQLELLNHIYRQSESIEHLVESLLQLAKIDAHAVDYHKDYYYFNDLIDQIKDHLFSLLQDYDVSIQIQNTDHQLYCDEYWMVEALENIIKNCVEQKRHSSIDIWSDNHSSYIDIYIQDHGDGINEEDRQHIFERFYRGQESKKAGIGIGLAISQGIIFDHHGHISVENHHGALFHIVLPHKSTKSKVTVTKQ